VYNYAYIYLRVIQLLVNKAGYYNKKCQTDTVYKAIITDMHVHCSVLVLSYVYVD